MLLNSWKNITLICGNHADNEHEMNIKEYLASNMDTAFYSCPGYISIYSNKKEGRSCNNRLSIPECMRILRRLDAAAEDEIEEQDLTGYRWEDRGVSCEVLEHKDGHFTVRVLNKKAMSK